MSQRTADRTYGASRTRADARRRSWLSRILLVLVGIVVILPVALILFFRFVPPPITPLMLATILTDGPISQRWVPLDAISPNLVRAVEYAKTIGAKILGHADAVPGIAAHRRR